jgi:thiamine monophosphate synthase
MIPRLYLVAPRALFATDADWLAAIERSAVAAQPHAKKLPIAIQIRIEPQSRTSPHALAVAALAAVGGRISAFLNAAGVPPTGYAGVHVPERRIGTDGQAASASVHSLQALQRAEAAGVAFVVFGPVWKPTWKDAEPVGVEALHRVCAAARVPMLAIGGVTPGRVPECIAAGSHGVAVASEALASAEPGVAIGRLVEALLQGLRES